MQRAKIVELRLARDAAKATWSKIKNERVGVAAGDAEHAAKLR